MVNSDEFSKRLQIILDYYDISAATFADAIQVGRSSISHIISGRNKPSLDFVLKIVQNYPEVELYWLLNGKGSFPKLDQASSPVSVKETEKTETFNQHILEEILELSRINQKILRDPEILLPPKYVEYVLEQSEI